MSIPFAALESRLNDAAIRSIANRTLTIDSVAVDGVFDDRFGEVNFIESSNPTFTAKTSDIPSVANGSVVMDGAKEYSVIGVERDGTGMTKLELRFKL